MLPTTDKPSNDPMNAKTKILVGHHAWGRWQGSGACLGEDELLLGGGGGHRRARLQLPHDLLPCLRWATDLCNLFDLIYICNTTSVYHKYGAQMVNLIVHQDEAVHYHGLTCEGNAVYQPFRMDVSSVDDQLQYSGGLQRAACLDDLLQAGQKALAQEQDLIALVTSHPACLLAAG